MNHGSSIEDGWPWRQDAVAGGVIMSAVPTASPRLLGIVLSGGDSHGTSGLRVIVEHGGRPRAITFRTAPIRCCTCGNQSIAMRIFVLGSSAK